MIVTTGYDWIANSKWQTKHHPKNSNRIRSEKSQYLESLFKNDGPGVHGHNEI